MNVNSSLYDKIVNVTFFSNDIQQPKKSILTPIFGFKPSINLNGMIIANSFFCNIELRIKNTFINFDYGPYQSVSIDAGYSGDVFFSGMSGQITQAYIETPGPDGVTVFMVKLTYEGLLDVRIDFEFTSQGTFIDLINKFIEDANNELVSNGYNFKYTVNIPQALGETQLPSDISIHINKSLSNCLAYIIEEYMQAFWSINGNSIVIFSVQYPSSKNIFEITRVTSTPRSTAPGGTGSVGHINFTSPWIINMRPGDIVHINPIYLKTSFGTFQSLKNKGDNSDQKLSYSPGYFSVYSISFEFDTVESINTMIVDALYINDIDINTGQSSQTTQNSKQIGKL